MLVCRTLPGGLPLYHSTHLDEARVAHAFTTRIGGSSRAPFDSLNLGNLSGTLQDDPENVKRNHAQVQLAIGCSTHRRRWITQVHGSIVRAVNSTFVDGVEADGLMSDQADDLLSIRVADCAPILLASGDGRSVAAVHAGWRGVVAGIVPNAVAALAAFSRSPSARMIGAIGPCIGFGAFEVGPEVWTVFQSRFGSKVVRRIERSEKALVDLRAAILSQLLDAGLNIDSIDVSQACTFSNDREFFSHRRDNGITGRMAALIAPAQ